jgi:hypothetical protein
VKLLIEYLANIHKKAPSLTSYGDSGPLQTPLQLLITKRQGELIYHTLMWCPDLAKGVSDEGETTVHAIVWDNNRKLRSKIYSLLYRQVVRGVNPLQLTKGRYSVLLYAAANTHCPQRMVAACIKLGFSTHQPALTQLSETDIAGWITEFTQSGYVSITSPLLLAGLWGLHVVAHMLYESGSCSPTELFHLYEKLMELSDPDTDSGRRLLELTHDRWGVNVERRQRYDELTNKITTFLPYLKEMVSTPRSLVSTCRLVISRCLTVRRRRKRAVRQLTLPVRSTTGEVVSEQLIPKKLPLPEGLKNYLLFSDLTDPDYAWYLHGSLPGILPPLPGRVVGVSHAHRLLQGWL